MVLRGWGYLRGIQAGFEDLEMLWTWTAVREFELFCWELDWFYGI